MPPQVFPGQSFFSAQRMMVGHERDQRLGSVKLYGEMMVRCRIAKYGQVHCRLTAGGVCPIALLDLQRGPARGSGEGVVGWQGLIFRELDWV